MRLIFERPAVKALRRMPAKEATVLMSRLKRIADSPFEHHAGATSIKGGKDWFRARHGDWRALYRIDRSNQVMRVEHVLHRKEAYR